MRPHCQKFLIFPLLLLPIVTSIETIPSSTNSFTKTFRPQSAHSNFEVKIEPAVKIEGGFLNINSLLYCLGSTEVVVTTFTEDTSVVSASSLFDLKDALAKVEPGTLNKFFSLFSGKRKRRKNSNANANSNSNNEFEHQEDREKGKNLKKFTTLQEYVTTFSFSPYQEKFVGVRAGSNFTLSVKRRLIKMSNLGILFLAVLLFIKAQIVAQQATVWYFGGVSLSVTLGALLLLYFIINKILPKRDSLIVVGFLSSFSLWLEYFFTGFVRQSIISLAQAHWSYVLAYFLLFGTGGFIYCYIKGPPIDNPRAATVLQVFIQIFSCMAMYYSFNLPEMGLSVIVVVVISYIFYDQFAGGPEVKPVKSCNNNRRKSGKWSEFLQKQPSLAAIRKKSNASRAESYSISPRILNGSVFNRKPGNDTTKSSAFLSKSADRITNTCSSSTSKKDLTCVNDDNYDDNCDGNEEYIPTPTLIIPKPKRRSFIGRLLGSPKASTPQPYKRLLSEDEYLIQGSENTRVELNKLRKFCNSLKADPWTTIGKVSDPKRLSSFVQGETHITQAELTEYEIQLDKSIAEGSKSFHVENYSDDELNLLDPNQFSRWESDSEGEDGRNTEIQRNTENSKSSTNQRSTTPRTQTTNTTDSKNNIYKDRQDKQLEKQPRPQAATSQPTSSQRRKMAFDTHINRQHYQQRKETPNPQTVSQIDPSTQLHFVNKKTLELVNQNSASNRKSLPPQSQKTSNIPLFKASGRRSVAAVSEAPSATSNIPIKLNGRPTRSNGLNRL